MESNHHLLDQTQLSCSDDRFRAAMHIYLAVNVPDVGFNSAQGDEKFLRDFFIG